MTEINKAHFDVDGNNLRLTMPIAKVDEERRIVSGFATLDNIDRQGDVLLSDASRKAFENFRGNVRLMHQPIPAGKVVSFRENSFYDQATGKTYSGIFVDAYISKGAENIWQMVLDGTLTGFSIGGRILDFENQDNEDSTVRVVKDYELMELSLVDSPANQFANIFSIQKLGDEIVTSGIATEFSTENVFWCATDKIAVTEKADSVSCPVCKSEMNDIGWVETSDITKNQEVGKLVDMYLRKADNVKNGDFVSWGSSGGTARGRVEHVMREGTLGIPDSDFSIKATPDDPAVLIRIWKETANGWEETETLVGHKMSTLTRISSLDKSMDENHEATGKKKKEIHKETVTNEATPNRNAEQGIRGGIPKPNRKKKRVYKSEDGNIEQNSFVAFVENSKLQKGKVELLNETNASIRLYKENSAGQFVSTNNVVVKEISELKKLKATIVKTIDESSANTLKNLVSQHNEKYGNVSSKKVTFAVLRKVFERGIDAYRNNPGVEKADAISETEWANGRVNGFLQAMRSGKFKNKPYDIDLLPMGHPLSMKKEEGGVEMADNETSHEELDTAQAVAETPEESVEFEVEETVEDVVNEALALAKSDEVQSEEESTTPSDDFDMEKALGEVKSFVEEALTKSVESSTESLDKITNAVLELAKAVDEKVGQLQSKYEEITKGLADLNNATTEIASRVESVEEETAMKKSGELENSIPEQPVMRKSLWGGRFLSSADLFN